MTTIRELIASGYDIDAPLVGRADVESDTAYELLPSIQHADSPDGTTLIVCDLGGSFVVIAAAEDELVEPERDTYDNAH